MTNYKEVFQLAQDKGYGLSFVDAAKMGLYEPLELVLDTKSIYLLELTLIQKWLRDEHKIFVTIDQLQVGNLYQYVIKWHDDIKNIEQYGKGNNSYESALLQGIEESLKLI